ncbi:MAG: hypothetical protein AAB473_00255 [Patescibacteria group bacterium]
MPIETPKLNPAEVKVPAVETEPGSRVITIAVHAREQKKREALVEEGVVIVEEPGALSQELEDARRDREAAEARELARREKFFADLVAKFPELTDVQRNAVRATMERESSRTWSNYDGTDTTIKRISIEGDVLTIVFDIEEMGMRIDEKVCF